MERRYKETESEYVREAIYAQYMRRRVCPTCKGAKLKKEALSVITGENKYLSAYGHVGPCRQGFLQGAPAYG